MFQSQSDDEEFYLLNHETQIDTFFAIERIKFE